MTTAVQGAGVCALREVPQHCISELSLRADREFANPFVDVSVTVTFRCGDAAVTRHAFWDGGRAWKVRFAPPSSGRWSWTSRCTDERDAGLHDLSGEIECVPYDGDNPNYAHGGVVASPNRRHFVREDGTPFFWLGDTHWQMPDWERLHENNAPDAHGRGQFAQLVEDRVDKGFTVYQTYFNGHARHWWRDDEYACVDPARFRDVMDPMMDHLAARGLVVALGIGLYRTSLVVPRASLVRLAGYIAARYGAHPMVWITAQEVDLPDRDGEPTTDVEAWTAAATAFARTNGCGRPVSGHQKVGRVTLWGGEPWHDWFALQGGHTNCGPRTRVDYEHYWNYQPRKPYLETEAMYENITCGPREASARDVREVAYKALLSGSYGFTYGAAAVWLFKWDANDARGNRYNPGTWWHEGMRLPGSTQMSLLKSFFEDFAWWDLTPRFAHREWCRFHDEETTVLATDANRVYVLYAYGEQNELGRLCNLDTSRSYAAWWFDPRTGERHLLSQSIVSRSGDWTIPPKPTYDDWVLVLRRNES